MLSALDVLFAPDARRVVLVGEPGSGKSTFLQYVTLCQTYQHSRAGDANGRFASLQEKVPAILQQQKAVPLRIILREFAPALGATGAADDVIKFLEVPLRKLGYTAAAGQLQELLQRGLAFVLFDGLDEVPRSQIAAVRQAITAFAQGAYQQCRIAVTCRTESYKKPEFKLAGFPKPHEIAPLSSALQTEFVQAWYKELEHAQPQFRGQGDGCAAKLITALATERLQEMASNPFFLTAMAALHKPDNPLPDTGAKLMNGLVNSVLDESRKPRADVDADAKTPEPELTALLKRAGIGAKDLRSCLEAIAYFARKNRHDKNSRFVDDDILRNRLAISDKVKVDEWLDALRHRAGLLQSQDGRNFEFAYRFEEFLAGCYLAKGNTLVLEEPHFHLRALNLLDKQGDYGRQVVIWAAGFIAHVQSDEELKVQSLVLELLPKEKAINERSLARLELAADIAHDARMEHWLEFLVPGKTEAVGKLRARLEQVRDGAFEIKARSRAASAIGRLRDPRPGVGLKGRVPDIEWIRIPATKQFPMGGKENWQGGGQFLCHLIKQPYQISRYPITVAQYQAFVDDKGYDNDDLWTDAGRKWRDGQVDAKAVPDWFKEEYRKESFPIRGPKNYGAEFQTPNHPRVGVSWFEAAAFCGWLSEKLKSDIRMPSEAEWERAAAGTKGRVYPWGKETDLAQRCNMSDTGIGHTSAVGLFPSGDTPRESRNEQGVADLAGNVWEWCRTKWTNDYKNYEQRAKELDQLEGSDARVLRGGSWYFCVREILLSSYRNLNDPVNRYVYIGFRVVVAGVSAR